LKPLNHHGGNPAIAHLRSKERAQVIINETRRRRAGDWGDWEPVSRAECLQIMGGMTGWLRDIRGAYRNAVFSVLERLDVTGVIHIGVASLSGIRPTWYEMQRIKNELFGLELTAVEIYPPNSEVVDGSDMFHMWILPGAIPFGLTKLDASRGAATPAGELLLSGIQKVNK
jgi:hypothetical protein